MDPLTDEQVGNLFTLQSHFRRRIEKLSEKLEAAQKHLSAVDAALKLEDQRRKEARAKRSLIR